MTIQSLFTTALISVGGLFASPGELAPQDAGALTCSDACLTYLTDEADQMSCALQCEVASDWPSLIEPITEVPDWMPASDSSLELATDHSWCLSTCDDESRSATDRETCRLNCATTWSVLTSTPEVCDGDGVAASSELCAAESACERGCFADAVICRDQCDEKDARATDVASCKLRCGNVSDLCSSACASEDPDAFVSTETTAYEYDATIEPGC